jgi:hypothetical protein
MVRSVDPKTRDNPWNPSVLRARGYVWTSCRGPHLGSGHVRPRQQTGHMIASDPIRMLHRLVANQGAVHIWIPGSPLRGAPE